MSRSSASPTGLYKSIAHVWLTTWKSAANTRPSAARRGGRTLHPAAATPDPRLACLAETRVPALVVSCRPTQDEVGQRLGTPVLRRARSEAEKHPGKLSAPTFVKRDSDVRDTLRVDGAAPPP